MCICCWEKNERILKTVRVLICRSHQDLCSFNVETSASCFVWNGTQVPHEGADSVVWENANVYEQFCSFAQTRLFLQSDLYKV